VDGIIVLNINNIIDDDKKAMADDDDGRYLKKMKMLRQMK